MEIRKYLGLNNNINTTYQTSGTELKYRQGNLESSGLLHKERKKAEN